MRFFLNILGISLLCLAFSCSVPRHIKKTYIGCYSGAKVAGIDTLLDLAGCFSVNYLVPFRNEGMGTAYSTVIFYSDGIVTHTSASSSIPLDNFDERMQREIHQINTDPLDNKYFHEGRGMYYWGLYELKGNIIKVQYIKRPYPPEKYSSYIVMYKVIDRHTIQEISHQEVLPPKETEPVYRVKPFLNKFYNFIPIEKLPSSDCWLKDEKWFWCNDEDWKEYRRQMKK